MPRPSIRVGGRSRPVRLAPPAAAGNPAALLHKEDMQYLGAFRVPPYYDSVDQFSYGGAALAYNPANDSLFVAGKLQHALAEITIPANPVVSANIDALPTASMIQTFVDILTGLPAPIANATDGQGIGGMLVRNGKIIGTQYAYYSGSTTQAGSHWSFSSTNLSAGSVTGLFPLSGAPSYKAPAGVLGAVPAAWQPALGASAFSGLSNSAIIATNSTGPAAFGFDPDAVVTGTAACTPYVYYDTNHVLGIYADAVSPIESGASQYGGVVFPEGAGTILYWGRTAKGYSCYGTGADWDDAYDGGYGPHSLNGQYTAQVWAYRAADFVLGKTGAKAPYAVLPYDVWNFDYPITTGRKDCGGVAYDPATGRIFVSFLDVDTEVSLSSLPMIHVWKANPPATGRAAAPRVGFTAVVPAPSRHIQNLAQLVPAAGPVAAGIPVTLHACNVFPVTDAASVASVAFYLGDGTLLGAGTAAHDLIDGTTTRWASPAIDTTGMPSGDHPYYAVATDSDGRTSAQSPATLTIA